MKRLIFLIAMVVCISAVSAIVLPDNSPHPCEFCNAVITPPVFDNETGNITAAVWRTEILPKTADVQPIKFYSLAYNASAWRWEFGGGLYSSEENPLVIFTSDGSYNVTLTAWNNVSVVKDTMENHINLRGLA